MSLPLSVGAEQESLQAAPLLKVSGLSSHYGRIQALYDIDLSVGTGQLVALVGANGAGKTTLLRAISGVQPISGGHVLFMQQDIGAMVSSKRVRAGISQVPEGRQVFGPMSVEDNLRLGAFTRGKAEIDRNLVRMYELFPILKDKRALAAGTLSGGQQQMLAMARALMAEPKLLLLDEPSMGLAPLIVQDIFRLIQKLRDTGITILIVEQNARAALSIADQGYVMELGRIVISGEGAELLDDDRIKQAYLGM
ncbi:MAG: ABC transporter ATP-binding protein [Polaromonas sp.]|jgi:branched-chain amino acid transport system ATP-binding protein